ncbi:flagellar motor protein MotB [bacterium]|nr:flagellar motor protein MotB [bacterium]
MAKKKKASEGGASQVWMLTFSDMMTLLLTFFVLLFSMSSTDSDDLNEALTSLQDSLSVIELGTLSLSTSSPPPKCTPVMTVKPGQLMAAVNEMKQFISQEDLDSDVDIKSTERGIVLSIGEQVLFDSGSTDVKASSYPLLHEIARSAARLAKTVRVEGNSDSTPFAGDGRGSNLELSGRRAINVLQVILEEKVLTPHGASVAALGDSHPIYPDEQTDDERRANRRVDVFIVDPPDVESFWYALMSSYLDNAEEKQEDGLSPE